MKKQYLKAVLELNKLPHDFILVDDNDFVYQLMDYNPYLRLLYNIKLQQYVIYKIVINVKKGDEYLLGKLVYIDRIPQREFLGEHIIDRLKRTSISRHGSWSRDRISKEMDYRFSQVTTYYKRCQQLLRLLYEEFYKDYNRLLCGYTISNGLTKRKRKFKRRKIRFVGIRTGCILGETVL